MLRIVPGDGILPPIAVIEAAFANVVVEIAGDFAAVVEYLISYAPPVFVLVNPSSPGVSQESFTLVPPCSVAESVVIRAGGHQSVCIV